MNLQMRTQQIVPPVFMKKNAEDRVFQVRYLQGLNLVSVKGWSITADVHDKYSQLLLDIRSHLIVRDTLNVHFKYDLFNGTTAKYLFRIIKAMNNAHRDGKTVKIYWSCDTENEKEMIETGLDYAGMCDFNFEITYS